MKTLYSGVVSILLVSSAWGAAPSFNSSVQLGNVQSGGLTEISGLGASRQNAHVIWAHNDSGGSATGYALNQTGGLHAAYAVTGASATDWEDMSVCTDPADGLEYVYCGDIGDNSAVRASIRVYRFAEPVVNTNAFNVSTNVPMNARYTLVYPDGARDAEVLLIDPLTGDIFIVSKRETPSRIYRAAYPQSTNSTITMSYEGSLTMGWVVGGDISPSGRQILLKTYAGAFYYERDPSQTVAEALTNAPVAVPYTVEPQGEAIGWEGRERGYFTISEGSAQPIYYYASSDSDSDGLVDSLEYAIGSDMADADSDDDGQTDAEEFIAGTSPTNSNAALDVIGVTNSADVATIQWYAETNRVYDILCATGTLESAASFTCVASNITVSTPQTISTNIPFDSGAQYLRVRVRRSDFW